MRARISFASILLAFLASSSQTHAQSLTGCPNLDGINEQSDTEITACAKSLINRQSLINTSTSIRNIVVGRFDAGPDQTEPAGLELTDPNEIMQRLTGNDEITIAPTAAAPARS